MTLYLKYRPQTFADVIGRDTIVTTLENALKQDQVAHAYLFCGTRGTGKTSVARILAKALLTRGIEDDVLSKQITKGVEDGSLVDLIEIDAASNRRIDDVRELIERIQFSPIVSRAKVYIIDEVHMLTKEAFNALLKTLEEPPEYAYFILATTELHKVPDTIQSRCQRFLFKRVREEDLISRLQYIADAEHMTVDREALRTIAGHATGSFRDAISLLDQLRSLPHITAADVVERIGTTGQEYVAELLSLIDAADVAAVPGVVARLEDAHIPLDHVMGELLTAMRTRMHSAIDGGQRPDQFLPTIDLLLKALQDVRISPVPGLVIESALLSLCIGQSATQPAVRAPAAAVRETFAATSGKLVTEQTRAAHAPATAGAADKSPALVEAREFSTSAIMQHWADVLAKVSPAHVKMSLKNGTIVDASHGTLTLSFPSAFHRDKVADIGASRSIEEILSGLFSHPIRLKCTLEQPRAASGTGPQSDLVEAAGEVFGGV